LAGTAPSGPSPSKPSAFASSPSISDAGITGLTDDLPRPPQSESERSTNEENAEEPGLQELKPLTWDRATSSLGHDDSALGRLVPQGNDDLSKPFPPTVDLDEEPAPLDSLTPDGFPELEHPGANAVVDADSSGPSEEELATPEDAAPGLPRLPRGPGDAPLSNSSSGAPDVENNLDEGQLVLRALLGVDGMVTARDAAEFCARLPGVEGCILVAGEQVEHLDCEGRLGTIAEGVVEKTTALAAELARGGAEPVRLSFASGCLRFFPNASGCVAVLTGDETFHPGVLQRLTLLSRHLGSIS